jgi:hypothetical protein
MKNKLKFQLLKALAIIAILFEIALPATAAKYVTVATIGGKPEEMTNKQDMQKAVDYVIQFWQTRINQVLPDKPDLIVLPEGCDYPQGLSSAEKKEYRNVRKTQVKDFFASVAKANHCYIAYGTVIERSEGGLSNTCIVLDRSGMVAGSYNKNFPTIGEMQGGIVAGTQTPLIKCDFGNLACAICFDLNFEELRTAYAALKPDIIVFPSMYHGGIVQENWAYQCRSFFVCAGGFREFPSEIRNPLGEVVASSSNYYDYAVAKINLDRRLVHLDDNGPRLKELKKKYGQGVSILNPGRLGSVLLSSEEKNVSVDQMIKEFNIELLDDYFARSRQVRLEKGIVRSK